MTIKREASFVLQLVMSPLYSVRLLYQRVRSDQLYETYSFEANVTCL